MRMFRYVLFNYLHFQKLFTYIALVLGIYDDLYMYVCMYVLTITSQNKEHKQHYTKKLKLLNSQKRKERRGNQTNTIVMLIVVNTKLIMC